MRGVWYCTILLTGFTSGRRHWSELANLNLHLEDLRKVEGGYLIRLRSSKTYQDVKGHKERILGEAGRQVAAIYKAMALNGHLAGELLRNSAVDLVK